MESKRKPSIHITTEVQKRRFILDDDGGKPRIRPPVAKISPNDPKPPGPPPNKAKNAG